MRRGELQPRAIGSGRGLGSVGLLTGVEKGDNDGDRSDGSPCGDKLRIRLLRYEMARM
jgi:hypothetical protein